VWNRLFDAIPDSNAAFKREGAARIDVYWGLRSVTCNLFRGRKRSEAEGKKEISHSALRVYHSLWLYPSAGTVNCDL